MLNIQEFVFSSEVLSVILMIAVLCAVLVSKRYFRHRPRLLFTIRRLFWPLFDRVARKRGRSFTTCKNPEEYVFTVRATLPRIHESFRSFGHDPSVASTLKYRLLPDGTKQYSVASWTYRETLFARHQHHAYVFPSVFGDGYDIYNHKEINNVSDPEGHTGPKRTSGDPDGVVAEAFSGVQTKSNQDMYDFVRWC